MMKKIMLALCISNILLFGCTEGNNNSSNADSSVSKKEATAPTVTPAEEAIDSYLQLKDALANDNGNAAAKAGKELNQKLQAYGSSQLTDEQRKVYDDIKEEALEHSEHIGENADKIDHQRSHFEMLSVVMYDLIKSNKVNRVLYKQYCPMYNDGKGGVWLSETKQIKNPFYGKEMPDCGEVKEEIKQVQ
jgi:hypothetical protein